MVWLGVFILTDKRWLSVLLDYGVVWGVRAYEQAEHDVIRDIQAHLLHSLLYIFSDFLY